MQNDHPTHLSDFCQAAHQLKICLVSNDNPNPAKQVLSNFDHIPSESRIKLPKPLEIGQNNSLECGKFLEKEVISNQLVRLHSDDVSCESFISLQSNRFCNDEEDNTNLTEILNDFTESKAFIDPSSVAQNKSEKRQYRQKKPVAHNSNLHFLKLQNRPHHPLTPCVLAHYNAFLSIHLMDSEYQISTLSQRNSNRPIGKKTLYNPTSTCCGWRLSQ